MDQKKILVVDDEKNIRMTLVQALESPDMPVETAVNGEEALAKLDSGTYALVLLDLRMPGMDGMAVLRRIRDAMPRMRVIIITAHGTIESAVDAMQLGAVDFIQKPFSPKDIRDLVQGVLAREELDEDSAVSYEDLVELCKRNIADGSMGNARETARRAIAAGPTRVEAYNLMGAVTEMIGDRLEAQKFYRMALNIDPTYKPAQRNLHRITAWPDERGRIELQAEAPVEDAPAGKDQQDA